ncbi:MAG: putative quinol monooxygenase [Dysgonamonadaceae bacterium]|nr:putative quinol monooxygenase [Dysgonamonadaceae bacterium]
MNQRLLSLLFLSLSLVFTQSLVAQQQETNMDEKPVVLFVEFEFDASNMDSALDLLTEMQNQALENEEGCIAYDILLNKEKPNTVFLYECYENERALKAHNNASYYKDIVDKRLKPLIKAQNILTLHPLNDMGFIVE